MSTMGTGRNANRKGRCLQAKDGGFVAAAAVTNAYIQTNKILTWKITNVKKVLLETMQGIVNTAVSLIKLNVQNKVLFIMLDLFVFR